MREIEVMPKLTFYDKSGLKVMIRAAQSRRDWMDNTFESFAYRCLPLTIANSHGWEILSPSAFEAVWDGTDGLDAIKISSEDDIHLLPTSHFGHGILTFHTNGVFRTDPGYNLWITGPPNLIRDGVVPLTGIVETDWARASFTMNWRFTRADCILSFEVGDPFCFFFPIRRSLIAEIETEALDMSTDPELLNDHMAWLRSREQFNSDLKDPNSAAVKEKWQKDYYIGNNVSGPNAPADHNIKLRLNMF